MPEPEAPPADPVTEVPAAELYQRGVQLGQSGDFVRAEQYLLAALARGGSDAQITPELIEICVADSRIRAALRHARAFVARHPDAARMRDVAAALQVALGDAGAAGGDAAAARAARRRPIRVDRRGNQEVAR